MNRTLLRCSVAIVAAAAVCAPLKSELLIEKLVVELNDNDDGVEDVEIFNNGNERAFISIEPVRIENPGVDPRRITEIDPEALGLLVSPGKVILDPGQRRLIRIASFAQRHEQEQVYRVLVKPVPAPDEPEVTGLNVMVGYDLLVLVRPQTINFNLSGEIRGGNFTVTNQGNSSVELLAGEQCAKAGEKDCRELPGKRLYVGQTWSLPLEGNDQVHYFVKYPGAVKRLTFDPAV
ncbi:fimbria/pilus periplasmic chaperone [Sphingomicrobium nitratireducens]|uniref:fimbria/pilus periplasmic chaperone n=1 Tax=Sphingomicrobium nitratireducens TaxID=2964666 RepID=UPI0022408A1D|nr:fimbria/pilus periplasmic chaperone [Sphingomicrobium nitratireducens]